MTADFWRVLERLGAAGSAAHDWEASLGDDWEHARNYLRTTPRTADTVTDPDHPGRWLSVVAEGETAYMAVAEEPPLRDPVRLVEEEVRILRPDWPAIAAELGTRLGFVADAWETEGMTRQIGIAQRGSDLPKPVVLHLPGGHIGDMARLLRDLARREETIVLLPSATWLTPDVQELQRRNRLKIITLAENFESADQGVTAFPISAALASANRASPKRHAPALHPQPGWCWDMVRIEVASGGRLVLSCDGQRKEFRFPKTSRKIHSHGYAIMMHLAVHQEWRNPPSNAPDHDKVRKRFLRVEELLADLVPMPTEPFRRVRGAFVPVFRVALDRELSEHSPVDRHAG